VSIRPGAGSSRHRPALDGCDRGPLTTARTLYPGLGSGSRIPAEPSPGPPSLGSTEVRSNPRSSTGGDCSLVFRFRIDSLGFASPVRHLRQQQEWEPERYIAAR
jgi:hypothetical protein